MRSTPAIKEIGIERYKPEKHAIRMLGMLVHSDHESLPLEIGQPFGLSLHSSRRSLSAQNPSERVQPRARPPDFRLRRRPLRRRRRRRLPRLRHEPRLRLRPTDRAGRVRSEPLVDAVGVKSVLAVRQAPRRLAVVERAQANGALDGGGGCGALEGEFGEGGDDRGVDSGVGRVEGVEVGGGGDEAEAAEGGLAAGLAAEDAPGVDVEDGDDEDDEGERNYGGEHDLAVEIGGVRMVEELVAVDARHGGVEGRRGGLCNMVLLYLL